MSDRKVRLTAQARGDFRTIRRYGRETWGKEQGESYEQRLLDGLQRLADFPELGRRQEDASTELRSFPVGEHIVFYLVRPLSISIVRILHKAADAESLLGEL